MNERLGFVYYGEDENRPTCSAASATAKEYSQETAKVIDEEVKKLIDRLYEETRQLLETNRDRVDAVAKALMRYETIDGSDIDRIMRGETLTKPTVSDLLDKENRRGTMIQPGPTPGRPRRDTSAAAWAGHCRHRGNVR